ncbi:hypothetical protein [Sulfuracidifex tepidarius]|uniref:Uncharacterized protein n=1 Tax=Sulfuracidifex tepidarius TaxID=1294262 RepID=A0A510DTM6_9CREN|nr:hypothetical protein [Sulfuracidifex tepidarius]BBG23541.1 hypothetical protein IC006_0825 [Sulfuracidifex tepidarius]BBG26295.1 hypothetical protein IC007_0800 [Sulfuracidifex tepidarius]
MKEISVELEDDIAEAIENLQEVGLEKDEILKLAVLTLLIGHG